MKKLALTILMVTGAFSICMAQKKDEPVVKTDTAKTKIPVADGSSYDHAIVITERSEATGDAAEYAWVKKNYPGSGVIGQSLNYYKKKPYDILHIKNADGVPLDVYFDISNFFGKW